MAHEPSTSRSRSASSRKVAGDTDVRGRDPEGPGADEPRDTADGFVVGPVVRWGRVATLTRALAATLSPDSTSWNGLERLVLGVTAPLRELGALAPVVERAMAGGEHAVQDVRARIDRLATVVEHAATQETSGHQHAHGCGCGCTPAERGPVYREGSDPSSERVLRVGPSQDRSKESSTPPD